MSGTQPEFGTGIDRVFAGLQALFVALGRPSALFAPRDEHDVGWDVVLPFKLAEQAANGHGPDARWLAKVDDSVFEVETALGLVANTARQPLHADLVSEISNALADLHVAVRFAADNSNPACVEFFFDEPLVGVRAEQLPEKVNQFRELVGQHLAQLNALPLSSAELPSNPASTESDLLDVREFAQIARVSGKTIYKLCKQPSPRGSLPHCRVGRKIRIKKAAALDWLNKSEERGPKEKPPRIVPTKGARPQKKPNPHGTVPGTGIKRRS